MKLLSYVIFIIVTYSATALGEIYRWQDSEGHVVYSDTPRPGAEIIELSKPTIVPAEPTAPAPAAPENDKPKATKYESVAITRPMDAQTIRNNDITNVNVAIAVRPGLQTGFGHRLQLLFDGQGVGAPGRNMSFTLPAVERGAHTLQAVILDDQGGAVIRSPISTFFVHKQSVSKRAR